MRVIDRAAGIEYRARDPSIHILTQAIANNDVFSVPLPFLRFGTAVISIYIYINIYICISLSLSFTNTDTHTYTLSFVYIALASK